MATAEFALASLQQAGGTVALHKTGTGTVNAVGVVQGVDLEAVDGVTIFEHDLEAWVGASGLSPVPDEGGDWFLVDAGRKHRIVSVRRIEASGEVVAYRLRARA